MRQLQETPHKMKPITPKERLLDFPIPHPEPRTSKCPQLLDYLLRRRLEIRLDFGLPGGGDDLLDFLVGKNLGQSIDQVLRDGEVAVVFPEGVEEGQEGRLEGFAPPGLFDVG